MTPVKVCGITRAADAELAAALGAAALGFVFWPSSPRFIDPYRVKDIVRGLPPFVALVGVFVDQAPEYVREVASLLRLSAIQLHGHEDAGYCRQLRGRLIKAVPLATAPGGGPSSPASDEPELLTIPPAVTVLIDAYDPERRGGTGRAVDWHRAARIAATRRTILAGGLSPDNVTRAVAQVGPYAVDVSSGVERRPGIKDPVKLQDLFQAVASIGAATPSTRQPWATRP